MNKVPTDFRRVTLMVSRMELSLAIYRDILGMEVHYDQQVSVAIPGAAPTTAKALARLVILKCNDPYIGMLGLMQLLDSPSGQTAGRPAKGRLGPGEAVLVMQHENVEAACEKLRQIEGVRIVSEPHVAEFPRGDGGMMRVEGMRFFDPDGFFVDLNQTVE